MDSIKIKEALKAISDAGAANVVKTVDQQVEAAKSYKSTFGQAGCHIENIGEILMEFDNKFISEDGGIIKLGVDDYLALTQMLLDKFKESLKECEGKEIVIDFGDGPVANTAEMLLRALGFKL